MKTFQAGQTYYTSSIGDSNCIIRATIVARTAKTVQARIGDDPMQVFRVKPSWDGKAETFKPWGTFSMAPTMSADDTRELRPDWERKPVAQAAPATAFPVVLRLIQGGRA